MKREADAFLTRGLLLQDPEMCEFIDGVDYTGPIPAWASYLLRFGYEFYASKADARRSISIISLPADSPGAGLVALGAMRRRLEMRGANDLSSHFERIKSGVLTGDRVSTLRQAGSRSRYKFDRVDSDGTLWLLEVPVSSARSRKAPPRFPVGISVSASSATKWQFEGEAPLNVAPGHALPWHLIYQSLPVQQAPIVGENLAATDSAICFAGRIAGHAPTKAMCESISFRANGSTATLGQLLSVQDWNPGAISRLSFFNSRTHQIDRATGHTAVVVADGDAAFLGAISHPGFERCHVIGVFSRIAGRDQLEAVGSKIEELRQWFEIDEDTAGQPPPGIHATTLTVRRT